MNKELLEKYKKIGKIGAQVLEYGCSLVKEGNKLLTIAEAIDRKIAELGAKPAFPVNLSVNDMAAHYAPTSNDPTLVKAEDYVKVDVGVHIDGYISDTARTIRVAGKDDLIICSEKMLEAALKMFTPGTKIGEIGTAIEEVAKSFGFNPIRNLTGHGLDKFNLHAGSIIPNIKSKDETELLEGEVYAVEPFCTAGDGFVKDSGSPMIFRWLFDHSIRSREGRKILELAKTKYERLPFAKRWLQKELKSLKIELALRQLVAVNSIYGYIPLREVSKKPVAQSEHTVIVSEKPIIITRV